MLTFIDYNDYKPDMQIISKRDKSAVSVVLDVNASNLADALLIQDVTGFRYQGTDFTADMLVLQASGTSTKPIIYKLDLSAKPAVEITYQLLLGYIQQTPKHIRLVVKTPEDYADLGTVLMLSQAYSNIHFCGGKFMAHPLGRFGCITQQDVNLYPDRQPPIVYVGCCLSELLISSSSDMLEYAPKQKDKPIKTKKNATTLFSLSQTGLGAF